MPFIGAETEWEVLYMVGDRSHRGDKGREGLGRAFSDAIAVSAFAKAIGGGQCRRERERRR